MFDNIEAASRVGVESSFYKENMTQYDFTMMLSSDTVADLASSNGPQPMGW